MAKVTKAHFELFKKECLYWQERFGLQGWELVFLHETLNDAFSQARVDASGRTVTTVLCIDWESESDPLCDRTMAESALHEMLHLLHGEISCLAVTRFCRLDEYNRAEEAVINVLVKEFIKLREDENAKRRS